VTLPEVAPTKAPEVPSAPPTVVVAIPVPPVLVQVPVEAVKPSPVVITPEPPKLPIGWVVADVGSQVGGDDFRLTGFVDVETLTRDDFCFIHRHREVNWFVLLSGSMGRYNQGINDAFYNGLASFNEATYTGKLLAYAKQGH
jgi:hypothetical protein